MRPPRTTWAVLAILGGLAATPGRGQDPAPAPAPSPLKPSPPVATEEDPLAREVVAAHNKLRAAENLPPLAFAPLLAHAAAVQAADMAEHGKMRHEGSDGSTPAVRIKRAGYRPLTTGENVAEFYPDVARVMQAWVDSPPHKKNILGDFTELGVARAVDKDGRPYWCVDFGKPMPRFDPAKAAADFVARLNDARVAAGHAKLAVDPKLTRGAMGQAADSAKSHGQGGTPAAFPGLDEDQYAELTMSTAAGAPTAEAVLKLFLDNPSYKERLMAPFPLIGVGYATDDDGTPHWCLILAKPRRR